MLIRLVVFPHVRVPLVGIFSFAQSEAYSVCSSCTKDDQRMLECILLLSVCKLVIAIYDMFFKFSDSSKSVFIKC